MANTGLIAEHLRALIPCLPSGQPLSYVRLFLPKGGLVRQTSALKFVRLLMLFAVCVTAQCLAGQLALAEPAQCSETAVEGDRCFSDASAEDEFDSGDGADDLPYLGFNADRCERASRLEQKLSVPAHGSFADRFPYRVPAVRAPPLIA